MGMEGELCPSSSLPGQHDGKGRRRRRRSLILTLSLALNLLLLIMPFFSIHSPIRFLGLGPGRGWTREASVAAEKAASYACSGHGEVYTDTLADGKDEVEEEGFVSCECHECYAGPDCSRFIVDCKVNLDSGDPLVFAPYWKENAKESAVVVPGWYRMSYSPVEGVKLPANVLPGLEREIRKLHALVGNAVTEGRHILIGIGSTQLLNVAVASIAATTTPFPSNVVAAVPYYPLYKSQTEEFQTLEYKWSGDSKDYVASGNPGNGPFIEFVTAPNNPDGKMETPILNGTNMFTIYDRAYYWPHFTAITDKFDHDIMIFTLSKVTGHAGSRLGWAIVKDYAVFQEMATRVQLNILNVAREAQLRAIQLLKAVNEGYSNANKKEDKEEVEIMAPPAYYMGKRKIFHFAYAEMSYRWRVISSIFESSDRFTLQHLEPGYCSFFRKVTGPSPAYAWVKCEREEEKNCTFVFDKAGIIGRPGFNFGVDDRFIRFSLLKRDSTFDNFVKHLSLLITSPTLSLSRDS